MSSGAVRGWHVVSKEKAKNISLIEPPAIVLYEGKGRFFDRYSITQLEWLHLTGHLDSLN